MAPFYVFIGLFGCLLTVSAVMTALNAAPYDYWVSYANYFDVHISTTSLALDLCLQFLVVVVNVICMKNFVTDEVIEQHGRISYVGVILQAFMVLCNLFEIVFLAIYPTAWAVGSISFASLFLSSCIYLPLLHHMILRQEAHG